MEVTLRTSSEDPDVQIVDVQGRIDSYTVESLDQTLEALIGVGTCQIVCNMSGVDFVSGHGLRTFLNHIKAAREQRGDLKLAALSPDVQRTFNLAGFSKACEMFATESEAVAEFAGGKVGAGAFDITLVGDEIRFQETMVDSEATPGAHVEETNVGTGDTVIDPRVEETIIGKIQQQIHLEKTVVEGDSSTGLPKVEDLEGAGLLMADAIKGAVERLRPYQSQGAYATLLRELLSQNVLTPDEVREIVGAGPAQAEAVAAVPASRQAFLVQMLGGGRSRKVPLTSGKITIGRDPANHVNISTPGVSPFHAEVSYTGADFLARDLGGENGITHDGERVTQCTLRSGDVLGIGPALLLFIDRSTVAGQGEKDAGASPRRLECIAGPDKGQAYPIEDGPLTIGADPLNDIVLPEQGVSDFHAQLALAPEGTSLLDLKTADGTAVNGQPVRRRALRDGDTIRIADTEFRFHDGPASEAAARDAGDATRVTSGPRLMTRAGPVIHPVYPIQSVPLIAGRGRRADIQINDDSASRQHAKIELTPEGIVISDMNSMNGVVVNGKKVARAVLKPGDIIRLGVAEFEFQE